MELMTVEEIAARLKLKKSWVYTHADRLGAFHLGKYLRFSWERVVASLESQNVLVSLPNDSFQGLVNKSPDRHRQLENGYLRKLN